MDAYDLFKKLSSGAKFDFKRFRSDAEKLQLVRPTAKQSTLTAPKKTELISNSSVSKEDTTKQYSDDEHSSSSSDDDSSESSTDSDDSTPDQKTANQSADEQLRILGNITSKGDNEVTDKQTERKKRKRKKILSDKAKLAALKQEQINHLRNVHRIHTKGTDIPNPMEGFEQLQTEYNLHPRIMENIRAVGYSSPTPIQVQAMTVMLHRREIMACAPTGSGKTAAFIVPILHHLKEPRNEGIRALVLAPTRELAKQTFREFQRLADGMGFRLMYIDKIGKDPRRLTRASRKIDILVSTPNRLIYTLTQSPPILSLSSVQWLVVDESDKLFEEGKSGFREQLGTIYKACDSRDLRRAMFSATFAVDVEDWCKLNLDNVIQVYIGARNSATKDIEQSLLFVGTETGKLLAIRDMIRQGIQPPVLVFVQSKERAKELFHEMIYDGMNVDVIHAERTQLQRDNVMKSFRAGKIWILIATELMSRGIDFKGVNLVVNYDFPTTAISYIHRIGRTGRAGRSGKAVTFFTEDDAVNLRSIANVMRTAGCPVPDYMLKINRPSKKIRRKIAKHVPKRARISTVPKYDLEKASKKRRYFENHKFKQNAANRNQEEPSKDFRNDSGLSNSSTKFKRKHTESGDEVKQKKPKTASDFKKPTKVTHNQTSQSRTMKGKSDVGTVQIKKKKKNKQKES